LAHYCCLLHMHMHIQDRVPLNHADKESTDLRITNTPNHLIWFVQISDLHLSMYNALRTQTFALLSNHIAEFIRPEMVVLSGDITDAMNRNPFAAPSSSGQQQSEWKAYRQIVDGMCMCVNYNS